MLNILIQIISVLIDLGYQQSFSTGEDIAVLYRNVTLQWKVKLPFKDTKYKH